jgi:tRNA threonylcarbamoyladenosine biosynthesis protein TsaE
MSISNFISHSEEETRKFAADFARTLQGDEKICLIGPLGAGKTTFARGFVEGLGISADEVASPTFTLIREYGDEKQVFHTDLYRLEKEEDIFEAGIHELLISEDIVLIEWADKLAKYVPYPRIEIHFAHGENGTRTLAIDRIK